jgi:hypothetical protein
VKWVDGEVVPGGLPIVDAGPNRAQMTFARGGEGGGEVIGLQTSQEAGCQRGS